MENFLSCQEYLEYNDGSVLDMYSVSGGKG